MRKTYIWTLPRTEIELGKRTVVMGILNVTPDSFSDGGMYTEVKAALARAHEMEDQGADILDIGGESTRPGSLPVSEEVELRRILPVVETLAGSLRIPISIDTYRSTVAQRALASGAQIVNDISAFRFDPEMTMTVQSTRAGIILMHSRGRREELHMQPPMSDPIQEVQDELRLAIQLAAKSGIAKTAIVVDPGIGFGKRAEESVAVLRNLEGLSHLEYPLLVGTSRKSFLGSIVKDRLWGTAATVAFAVMCGAHIVRVHDVAEMRTLVDVLDSLEQ
jgi:dihydropteroate synthase